MLTAARRRALGVSLVALLLGCASTPPPPPLHTGWSLRYLERTGTDNSVDVDRTELALAALDGRARGAVVSRGVSGRWSSQPSDGELCHEGRCAPSSRDAVLTALAALTNVEPIVGATESEPTFRRLDPGELVAQVRTEGGRFVTALRFPGGRLAIEVSARWISSPDDTSATALRAYFLTGIRRLGATRLEALLASTVGLPLSWEVTLRRYVGDSDDAAVGIVRQQAVEISNPPSSL